MKSGTVWAKCGAGWQILGAMHAVATVWEGSFLKKTQKLLTKFSGLATSGRHNSAMNWLPNGPVTECLVFIFTVRINSKSFPWAVHSVQERYLPKFSATSDVRYCVLKPNSMPQCWCGLASDILKKSRLNWKLKISNRQTTLASLSRRHVTLGIVECRN